jgi:hypothetical protein
MKNSARKQFEVPFEESSLLLVSFKTMTRTSMKFSSLLAVKAPG